MANSNSKERAAFAALLAKEFDLNPGYATETAAALQRIASGLDRIAERQCNGYSTPAHTWDSIAEARDEKREEQLEARARKICAERLPGAVCNFQGDPRGYVFKLRVPSGAYNTFGGAEDGWGVPS